MYEDSRIRRAEEEIERRKDEMFELKDETEKIREKIVREEPTSRKNEHFNELDLVQKETRILENEVRNRLGRNKIQLIELKNAYQEETKNSKINLIADAKHNKRENEINKHIDKNQEYLNAIKAISDNNLLDYSKEDDYRNICVEYDGCFAIDKIVKDMNNIDKLEDGIEKNVLKGIMKDEEFVNMIKEVNSAQNSIISTVRDKDRIDRDNLEVELQNITDLPKPFRDFGMQEYKDDVHSYVNATDFYSYELEHVPYSDKSEINLARAVSLAKETDEAAWKNLSHKTIKTLDKSVDMVAKLEVIHHLRVHLTEIATKDQKIGNYDFTEAQKQVKDTLKELEKYEKDLSQELDKTNYHEIDIEKEDAVRRAEWREEMRQEAKKPVEKPSNEITNDVQKEQSTPAPSSTNNELDDMFAEDRLSDLPKGMTPEMVAVASDILFRNGMVESNDINNLSSKDMDRSIDYAEKIQTFKGMSESQIAEEMAKDPWIDENGRYHEKGEITPMDVMAQQNINRTHNVYNKINNAYGFTDEQNMTM